MKIFKQDITSEIEAWYLGNELSTFQAECDIFVNPKNKYIYNKVIIVNDLSFDYKRFVGKNLIISRFPLQSIDYLLLPYIVSNDFIINEPFRKSIQILYPHSLSEDNCEIVNGVLRLKYNYISVESDQYKGYLTQVGFIAALLGII